MRPALATWGSVLTCELADVSAARSPAGRQDSLAARPPCQDALAAEHRVDDSRGGRGVRRRVGRGVGRAARVRIGLADRACLGEHDSLALHGQPRRIGCGRAPRAAAHRDLFRGPRAVRDLRRDRDACERDAPGHELAGVAVAAGAIVFMPLLARAKGRVAAQLGSAATAGDAAQSWLCAISAAAALASILANAALGWWWLTQSPDSESRVLPCVRVARRGRARSAPTARRSGSSRPRALARRVAARSTVSGSGSRC